MHFFLNRFNCHYLKLMCIFFIALSNCENHNHLKKDGRKITNDYRILPPAATKTECLWHVEVLSFFQNLEKNQMYPFLCGGSFVDSHVVITAAHCLVEEMKDGTLMEAKYIMLAYTSHIRRFRRDWDEQTKVRTDVFRIHPEYDPKRYIHDVGLIRVGDVEPARLLKLPLWRPLEYNFTYGRLCGRGIHDNYNDLEALLKARKSDFLAYCRLKMTNKIFNWSPLELKYIFSTKRSTKGGSSGDSGGAFVIDDYNHPNKSTVLIGVYSTITDHINDTTCKSSPRDRKICIDKLRSEFVNVFEYNDWIRSYFDEDRWIREIKNYVRKSKDFLVIRKDYTDGEATGRTVTGSGKRGIKRKRT